MKTIKIQDGNFSKIFLEGAEIKAKIFLTPRETFPCQTASLEFTLTTEASLISMFLAVFMKQCFLKKIC